MNTSKKINVNFSSLVGLKAELLRKQSEIKDARAKEDAQPKLPKPRARSKKIKEKEIKKEPDYTEIEDVATLKKSRLMLEAKSMLYDQLKKTRGDETRSYLVDFSNKPDEDENSEDEIYREEDYEDANSDPEDDWIEYKDCFGRTRKCLRRDLPKMREKDNLVKREITKEPPEERAEEVPAEPVVPPVEKEPEIVIMRKKWEEQMERLSNKTDIHYQDVLFDEARAHGVGYYAFSQNEEERAKQQANLAKLRKETEQRQKESQEIRDLKSKVEFNRLKAATVRKRIRAGLSAELTEEEEEELRARVRARNSNEEIPPEEETTPEAMQAAANRVTSEKTRENSLVLVEDKIKAFGQLLGKRPKWHEMSQEEWLYKRRKDRLGEFAPVYENFRRAGYNEGTRDTRLVRREDHDEDPMRINSAGPEPTDLWESQGPSCESEETKEESLKKEKNENLEKESQKDEKDEGIMAKGESESNDKTQQLLENVPQKRESSTEDESDDEEIIGPIPPSLTSNSKPATFINSFVPQPMSAVPQMPVSFDKPPPVPIVNFSIPPPSIISPLQKLPMTDFEIESTDNRNDISLADFSVPPPIIVPPLGFPAASLEVESKNNQADDSSDSEESIIIGPVPPPTINVFPQEQSCGPRLIDNKHINILSDIPLPPSVPYHSVQNVMQSLSEIHSLQNVMQNLSETPKEATESTGSLDVQKISAGLKYLRQKFDNSKS